MPRYTKSRHSELLLPEVYNYGDIDEMEESFGEGRRVSMPYNQQRQTHYPRVHPAAHGSLKMSQINTKGLINKPVKEVIRTLVRGAASMSDAYDLYKQYISSEHHWETESTRDERRLQDMEARVTIGGGSFQTILNQFTFGMVVEGAVCGEVTGNRVEGLTQINAISPFEITFQQEDDPRRGIITLIGQGIGRNFNVLQDPRVPNPYFVYDPINNDSTEPWGSIPFLPGITAEIMSAELFTKTDQYIDGQIYPKGFFSLDLSAPAKIGLDAQTTKKWVEETYTELKAGLSSANPSEAVVSRMPLLWTLFSGLGKVSLEGLEMLDRIISRNLQRAYKVPGFLYNAQDGGGIQSSKERTEMLLWLRRTGNYQRMLIEAFTQWGNLELEIQGSRGECQLVLDDTDLEGMRLVAEYDQMEATARYTQAQADEIHIRNGTISREEARATLIANDERYVNLPAQVPDLPEPQPEPEPTPEPEGDN